MNPLSLWLTVVTTALLVAYVFADIKNHFIFMKGSSNQLWFEGIFVGTLVFIILFLLNRYGFITI